MVAIVNLTIGTTDSYNLVKYTFLFNSRKKKVVFPQRMKTSNANQSRAAVTL